MRRLVAANLVPERAGQPVKAWVHISLADLLLLDADSALQEQWTAQVRQRWAARRARASETGASDGAWLDGDAAGAIACDAAMAPIVTGDVNVDALEDLVRLCVELDRLRRGGRDAARGSGGPGTDTTAAWAALEQAVIGKAVDLLSGPGGLASFLRRRQLGARLGGPSLPLDIGYAETIPAGIRNAVTLRDRHCQWAGGCTQPASACEVHHTKHKANGGKTSSHGLRPALPVPPPDRHPPLGLDPGPEPGRDDHRVEQGQHQDPAQPRTPGPAGVTPALPGEEFVVQGAVAHQAVGGRHQDGLKDPVPAGQGAGGHTGLLAVEQGGAGADGRAGGPTAQRRGSRLHGGVAPEAPGLPGLVVGTEEGPLAVEGQAHRGRDRRSVSLVGGQQDRLRVADRSQSSVGKGRIHAL